MISRFIIRNFRSIENLDITLSKLNAFIGYNNAGKSNIMDALNIVLGEKWPMEPFTESDFHDYDQTKPISIEVRFAEPLLCRPDCQGFKLESSGTGRADFRAIDANGKDCRYYRLNTEAKIERSLLYLGLDRQAGNQLRPTGWTIYGKLLHHIERTITDEHRRDFKTSMDGDYTQYIEPYLQETLDSIKSYAKKQTGKDLTFSFNTVDPLNILKNVRPYLIEGDGRRTDLENVGSGIQSAVSIAIARAYSEIVRIPVTIAIEEPELYLHPHASRHFYELLKELSGGLLQVLYTTHNRCFVDVRDFKNIYLVNKVRDNTVVTNVNVLSSRPRISDLDIISKTDENINEVFFSECVILVEGFSDKIAWREALKKEGVNINLKNISIIEVTGKNNLVFLADMINSYGIRCYVIIDYDGGANSRLISDLKAIVGVDNVLVQNPNLEGLLGLGGKLNREQALTIIPGWFAANSTPTIFQSLAQVL